MNLMKRLVPLVAAVSSVLSAQWAHAAPTVTILSDTGTLVTTTYAAPASTSGNSLPSPYGSGSVSLAPVVNGIRMTLNPGSGFFASANNLAGGKTSTFAGTLA